MESDLTLQILKDIRADIATVRADLASFKETTTQRFDQVDASIAGLGRRIDQTNRYMLAMEARFSTEISALRAEIHEPRELR